MNSAREILDAHETAQRRAYACAVFFICAALLANSVSFGVAYFFSRVGDFSAISPYAISAYLDLAIAADLFSDSRRLLLCALRQLLLRAFLLISNILQREFSGRDAYCSCFWAR